MRAQSELRPYQQDIVDFLYEHEEAQALNAKTPGREGAPSARRFNATTIQPSHWSTHFASPPGRRQLS